jgi:hypothetical protein
MGSMDKIFLSILLVLVFVAAAGARDLGNLSTNPYAPNSISNPYGVGNPYNPDSVRNPCGRYGNP